MANDFLTLLQLAQLRGTDASLGILEEVTAFAPELDRVMGSPITGISNTIAVSTKLNEAGAFRSVNAGVNIGSSKYQQKRFDCFFWDAALQVDEALVRAAIAQGGLAAAVQAAETVRTVRQKAITLGKQLYTGKTNDAAGFDGLIDLLDAANLVVDAGGAGATTYRAWFIYNAPEGVKFIFSENGIQIGQWFRQQVADPADATKRFMADVNNVSGFVGLQCGLKHSIGCIKNITSAKPLTDDLAYDLLAKFPIGFAPNLCFVERNTRRYLQQSRSVTVFANLGSGATRPGAAGGAGPSTNFAAPVPMDVAGVPLVCTDSIVSEAAS